MKRLKIHSICDLGCGAAFGLKAMQTVGVYINHYIDYYGFDNEEILISMANIQGSCKLKDIITLVRYNIYAKSLLYFWEPLRDYEMCKAFVNNLCEIAYKNQYIVFECAGYSLEHMRANNKVKELGRFHSFYVFQKVME